MPQFIGTAAGLLIFAAMIIRGAMAGNPIETVLSRALVGLFAGVVLGGLAGWAAIRVVREHLDDLNAVEPTDAAPADVGATNGH